MELLEMLKEFESLRVCDEETVGSLNKNNEFIKNIVEELLVQYKTKEEHSTKHIENTKRIAFGSKLLFLEDLVCSDQKTQETVISWLNDAKRKFLFTASDYGDVYGQLLLAKTNGKLEEFRQRFNPGSSSQPQFEYKKTLEIIFAQTDINSIENGRKLIEEKFDRLMSQMNSLSFYGLGYVDEEKFVDKEYIRKEILYESSVDYDGDLMHDIPERIMDYFVELNEEEYISNEDLEKINVLKEDIYASVNKKSFEDAFGELVEIIAEIKNKIPKGNWSESTLAEKLKAKILSNEEPEDYDGVEEILEESDEFNLFEDFMKKSSSYDEQFDEVSSELKALYRENIRINETINDIKKLGEKYRKPRTLTYKVELSEKDPLDIRFGNDSGCCIGVYENSKKAIGNCEGIPHYLSDNAVYIFNITQKTKGKERRTGMVLAFDTRDLSGNKVLACNSVELSPSTNPYSCIKSLVEFVEKVLSEFGKQNGFKAVLMSNHIYNTSHNYSSKKNKKPKIDDILKKINPPIERPFYSEIVNYSTEEINTLKNDRNEYRFYAIYDIRHKIKKVKDKKEAVSKLHLF